MNFSQIMGKWSADFQLKGQSHRASKTSRNFRVSSVHAYLGSATANKALPIVRPNLLSAPDIDARQRANGRIS